MKIKDYNKFLEAMKVDSWGRLHDEESKILYPYDRIEKFVEWFQEEWGDYAAIQGWAIFCSDTDVPRVKYKSTDKFGNFFQVQRIDNPSEGESELGILENDSMADEMAEKLGLILDEFGLVIGWRGQLFVE